MKTTIATTLILLAAQSVGAQTVYRCGNSYSQVPCAGGSEVAVAKDPGNGDAARARAAARVDAERAAAYEKARLAQEKAAPGAIVLAQPVKPAASAPQVKKAAKGEKGEKKKPEHFTAVAPKKN